MPIDEQIEHCEKEDNFNQLFSDIREYYPNFKYGQLRSAIEKVAPAYISALRERKKRKECIRKLRYIGYAGWPEILPIADDDEFFRLGQIYESTTFNGATYTIKGYGEGLIGCAYFERVK